MKATLVPDALTTTSAPEVAAAIKSAWQTLEGVDPSQPTTAVLTAQSALETGRWASMHCWNFGNVKAGPLYEGSYCQFRCNEVLNGVVQWFDPPNPQCNFRAFGSLEVGVLKWLQALKEHFPFAYEAAKTGMPLAFVHALKLGHYFTADEAPYANAVARLWKEYCAMLAAPERDTTPAPPDDEAELHAEALAAVAGYDWNVAFQRDEQEEST